MQVRTLFILGAILLAIGAMWGASQVSYANPESANLISLVRPDDHGTPEATESHEATHTAEATHSPEVTHTAAATESR